MFTDFVLNGEVNGPLANVMNHVHWDPGMMRPYIETNPLSPQRGKPCVTINTGRKKYHHDSGTYHDVYVSVPIRVLQERGINSPVFNATAMRKEDWIRLDQKVVEQARPRLKAWADLAAANTYGGFNGMSKMTIEYEAVSDPGEAIVDMSGVTPGRNDAPLFKLRSLPLPITHSNFEFDERRLAVSRNSGTPLDTSMAGFASRRVAEKVEKTTIGIETGAAYGLQSTGITAHDVTAPADGHGSALGGSNVYGYANYPHRLTKTNFTVPTTTNGPTTYNEILVALSQLFDQNFFGPFMLYHSKDWTTYMNTPFSTAGGNHPGETLRTMLLKNPDIMDVRRLDFLTSTYTFLFVQMQEETARAVIGQDITTIQWETIGGMMKHFKVMCIYVPQVRSDYNGQCGILHGTTA